MVCSQKFRSQGGEGFEALQAESLDETIAASQTHNGADSEQRVSDSLLEAGFVKPLQHEDPNADQEQTARIGGRLVESGFGRLQFEDAMEHDRQWRQEAEGLQDTDSIEGLEGIIAGDDLTELSDAKTAHSEQHGGNLASLHAGHAHVTEEDPLEAENARNAELAQAARTHVTGFEDDLLPLQTERTHAIEHCS